MLCGLVAPEIIILWAMRQWHSARRIGQAHKGVLPCRTILMFLFKHCLRRQRVDHDSWVFLADGRVYDA